ncbi:hypothetical protein F443_11810 [Phytophthora nicotianae P1569]|uniref:Uncharacterized protein n=1 Tax=Phytophthora nicotianae P1569 TaxID=1317065 RepID=V9EYM8_PHYNI|nr:hypothetical protein F443_11810 [Phytophthora nicotianae P1569]
MDRRSLVRELVRARVGELMGMTNKLDKIGTSLEKILRAQMELLSCMRKSKENIYALASEMGDIGVDHTSTSYFSSFSSCS